MARVFIYNSNKYDDPGDAYSIEDVRQHLTQFFPELASATHTEKPLDDGNVEITFAKKVGTKGAELRRYRVEGDIEFGRRSAEVDLTVEARDEAHALVVALDRYALMRTIERQIVRWDTDVPPEITDLGPVPEDVLMRRAGQPELPLGCAV